MTAEPEPLELMLAMAEVLAMAEGRALGARRRLKQPEWVRTAAPVTLAVSSMSPR
jgi:hypothetical protein